MKTTKKITGVIAFAILLFTLISGAARAQCGSFFIHNTLSCPVTVDINVYTTCPPTSACNTVTGHTIGAGVSFPIPCGSCSGGVCDISVTVQKINGNATGLPITIDFSTSPQFLPSTCNATAIKFSSPVGTFVIQ